MRPFAGGPRFAGRRLVVVLASVCASSCVERQEPPGAGPSASGAARVAGGGESEERADSGTGKAVPGTIDDNLPFVSEGTKVAATAWRTWIYTDTGPKRWRYGYYRAGEIFDVRGPKLANEGCAGGWFRVNPRGFVCVGKGATTDLQDPVVLAASVRPIRGQGLPYVYAMAAENPPLYYFKLPSKAEMKTVEGDGVAGYAARWRERMTAQGMREIIGEPAAPPDFMSGRPIKKPYGVIERLHFSVHSGRASTDSGFAFSRVVEWEGRAFGLSTEHDLIALDRTEIVRPSAFQGVELAEGEGLPVGFVEQHYAQRHVLDAAGQIKSEGSFRHREGLKLSGNKRPGDFWETRDGAFVAGSILRKLKPRTSFPSFATGDRKWIDISIGEQSLIAYVGTRPVYATLVSTGRGGMGDPEKAQATIRGTFMVYQKHVSSTMDGEDDVSDSFNLQDVPFVQYFHKGFAIHGTYWHDEFGKIRSHGCVNLSPVDAAWLFEWTDPSVPPGWHGAINKERGTVVYIHG
jgi:lipoprotein-anchoring transpeptidase ErfK/SrfK